MNVVVVIVTLLFRAVFLAAWLLAQVIRGIPSLIDGFKTYLAAAATISAGVALICTGHPLAGGVELYHGLAIVFAGLGLASLRHAVTKARLAR